MSDFVEQCRSEWKRLGVPASPAEEMAADLASDLAEAEAEGVSAEEVLGSSASDPRAFAASWAAERGLVPESHSHGAGARGRPPVLVAFTAVAAIVAFAAALLLATGEPKVGLVTAGRTPPRLSALPAGPSVSGGVSHRVQASAAAPVEWILLLLAIAALGFAVWLWSRWSRSQASAAPVQPGTSRA